MKARAKRRGGFMRERGFTTLELLLSLSLLVIITAALSGGFRLAVRTWESSRVQGERGEMEAVAKALSGLVGAALPMAAVNDQKVAVLVFEGRGDSLGFVGLNAGETQEGGLIQSKISLFPGKSGTQDLKLWTAVFRPSTAWSMGQNQIRGLVIAGHIRALKFRYFGTVEPARGPEWRDEWIGRDRLPQLVSIHIVYIRANRELDIPINVALHHS